jgi:hypothetical protein
VQHKLAEGAKVEIVRGPLVGVRGKFLRNDDARRMILVVTLIQQTAIVEIHPADVAILEPVEVPRNWFYTMSFFLPREIRSPALDYVLEDRKRLSAEGHSRWRIELITASQCLGLVAYTSWRFLWDVLNPFKSRPD